MSRKIRAQIQVYAVEIICPACQETVPPPNGSFFWSVEEVDLATTNSPEIQCPQCESRLTIQMPKDVR